MGSCGLLQHDHCSEPTRECDSCAASGCDKEQGPVSSAGDKRDEGREVWVCDCGVLAGREPLLHMPRGCLCLALHFATFCQMLASGLYT